MSHILNEAEKEEFTIKEKDASNFVSCKCPKKSNSLKLDINV